MPEKSPDISFLEEVEAHAVRIAHDAGQILVEQFHRPLGVEFKGKNKNDPVTVGDKRSEQYLQKAIRERFPEHGILGEEGGVLYKSGSPFIWVIDPLDGTANFMNGLPVFAVSVGVLWNLRPVAGAIFVPISHQRIEGVYHAHLDGGAFFNNEKITVSTEMTPCMLSETPVQFAGRLRISGKDGQERFEARNLGSIAFEMAIAAAGVFQFAVFSRPKLWDVAAGAMIVKEAGGLVMTGDSRGKKWTELDRFRVAAEQGKDTLDAVRGWSSPVVAGTPDIVRRVAENIHIRRSGHFLPAMLRWLGIKKAKSPTKAPEKTPESNG